MAKLVFLGTKGEIEESTPRHRYHSSLLIEAAGTRLLIDYGLLRRYGLAELRPDAILITHAHPDHYAWLKEDLPYAGPVYLTRETLAYGKFQPAQPRLVAPGAAFAVGPVRCSAYPVIHSIRCPAVGWKLHIDNTVLVYNSDLVDIADKDSVLDGVGFYIGDGSAVRANLVRRRGDVLFGHTRMTTQINWCRQRGIGHTVFTHLGSETLREETAFTAGHPGVILAYDGLELAV